MAVPAVNTSDIYTALCSVHEALDVSDRGAGVADGLACRLWTVRGLLSYPLP